MMKSYSLALLFGLAAAAPSPCKRDAEGALVPCANGAGHLSPAVVSGDTCWKLLNQPSPGDWNYFAEFRKLNPSVNADCTNLQIGQQYCIPPPPGPYCPDDWVMSKPIPAGTTCWELVGGYGDQSLLNKFYACNPGVDSLCHNLVVGQTYKIPPTSPFVTTVNPNTGCTQGVASPFTKPGTTCCDLLGPDCNNKLECFKLLNNDYFGSGGSCTPLVERQYWLPA
jgi:hypothetical protein